MHHNLSASFRTRFYVLCHLTWLIVLLSLPQELVAQASTDPIPFGKPTIPVASASKQATTESTSTFSVTHITPAQGTTQIAPNTNITIQFSRNLNTATLNANTLAIVGSQTGQRAGFIHFPFTNQIRLEVTDPYEPGEVIRIQLSAGIEAQDGSTLVPIQIEYTAAVGAGDRTFNPPHVITTTADGVNDITVADLNGDGNLDVLSASPTDNTLAWYENNGNQTFSRRTISTAPAGVNAVSTSDLDQDGDLDVLATSETGQTLAWYENNGSQTFTPHTITNTATGARALIAADLDGDHDLDLIAAAETGTVMRWYKNDGNEAFTADTLTHTEHDPTAIYDTDLDKDGDIDIVVAFGTDSRVMWYENDGGRDTFSFIAHTVATGITYASGVFATDLDGDGDIDILSASRDSHTIAWHENNGSQVFTSHTIDASANGAQDVHATDVDGDGDMDVVVASEQDDTVAWYQNNGSESFSKNIVTTTADGAVAVASADLDNDGDADIVTASALDDTIAWYEQGPTPFSVVSVTPQPYATDIARDGTLLTLTLNKTLNTSTASTTSFMVRGMQSGPHTGTFSFPAANQLQFDPFFPFLPGETVEVVATSRLQSTDGASLQPYQWQFVADVVQGNRNLVPATPLSTTADGASSVYAADLNRDTHVDVVAASFNDDRIIWYKNQGNQTFTETTIDTNADGAYHVHAADMDSDGDMDILSASIFNNTIAWYDQLHGDFFAKRTITSSAFGVASVHAADVDSDGDMDVVAALFNTSTVAWYENDGTQAFTARTVSIGASSVLSVYASDMDGDGDIDILSASRDSDTIAWHENDGNQVFTTHTISALADGAAWVYATDVDRDGDVDVLSASENDHTIAWYENDGSQSFTTHAITTTATGAFSVYATDLDGDGDTDVLSASHGDNTVAWYENDGTQTFTTRTITTTAVFAFGVHAADLDSDGNLDVVSASMGDDTIAWYEQRPTSVNVVSTTPSAGATHVAANVSPMAILDASFQEATGLGRIVRGSQTNAQFAQAVFTPTQPNVTLDPSRNFLPGEIASIVLPNLLPGTGIFEPYQWQFTVASGPGAGIFQAEQPLSTTSDGAAALYPADVDNDGDTDILGASTTDNTLVWFQNDGIGAFTPQTISTSEVGITTVHGADLDFNGNMDVIVGLPNEVAWFQNATTRHSITTSVLGVRAVYAADVDTDGYMDILSASSTDNTIAWYEHDGTTTTTPTFTAHTITNNALGVAALHVGDLDRDGDMDILSASETNDTIAWYENDGATLPTFTAHTITTTADQATSVYAQDLDGDGDLDVLAASTLDDTIAWFENDGAADPSFTPHTITTASDGVRSVQAADVDGDGDMDIVAAAENANTVAWYENDGTQTFTLHTLTTNALGANTVYAADLDGDRDLDVVAASSADDTFSWYPQNPPAFSLTTPSPSPAAANVAQNSSIQATFETDLNTSTVSTTTFTVRGNQTGDRSGTFTFPQANQLLFDSAQDFRAGETIQVVATKGLQSTNAAVVTPYQWQFTTQPTVGPGFFTAAQPIGTPGTLAAARVRVADVDGDGDLDAVTVGNALMWHENDGNEHFVSRSIAANHTNALFVADLDSDNDLDLIATVQTTTEDIVWYENDGTETFTRHTIVSNVENPNDLVAADVDGDGDLDVISAERWRIVWYENDGAESFTLKTIHNVDHLYSPTALHAVDFDNDGDLDVAVGWVGNDTIVWYENSGSGAFGNAQTVTTTADGISDLDAADVDGDGDLDLLSASFSDATVAWYENTGVAPISFTQQVITNAANGASGVMAADKDGDGDLDVLAATLNDGTVTWFVNDGAANPNFSTAPLSTTITSPQFPVAADMDSDGDLDVIVPQSWVAAFGWYEQVPAGPQLIVQANNVLLADGDATPSNTDDTDFGMHAISSVTESHTFTITSIGTTALNLGLNAVSISGSHASDFSVTSQPDPTVDVGTSTTFTITFDPSAVGLRTATVAIMHDATDAPFTFTVQGTGVIIQQVLTTTPSRGAPDAVRDASVAATMNFDINTTTVSTNTYRVRGSQTGTRTGTLSFPAADQVVFDPTFDFRAGEQIEVVAAADIQSTSGDALRAYQWQFNAATRAASRTYTVANAISTTINGPASIYPVDLDGDGDLDIVVGTQGDAFIGADDSILWYENNGTQTFTVHTVHTGIADVTKVTATDLDDDGDIDVLSSSYTDDTIAWYENNGSESFTRHIITTSANGAFWAQAEDVDSDGDLDVLTVSSLDNTLAWYENNGSEAFTRHTISTTANQINTADAGDLDGDGDIDVVGTAWGDNTIYWYENDGSATPGFTTHTLATNTPTPRSIQTVDLDSDGDLDVVVALQTNSEILWYENDGAGTFALRLVAQSLRDVWQAFATDLDGDGDIDVLASSLSIGGINNAVVWYENNGSEIFTLHRISTSTDPATIFAVYAVVAADMDGDLDLDVVVASASDDQLAWYDQATLLPDLNVVGNGTSISSGDTNPDTADHTHFGAAAHTTGARRRGFTLQNTGNGPLTLGTNAVTISGDHASDFAVTTQPATALFQGHSTTFGIVFTPSAPGNRTATVSIANDDPDESPYTFAIEGVGHASFAFTTATPQRSATNIVRTTNIAGTVTRSLDPASVSNTTFAVHGSQSGLRTGAFSFPATNQVIFNPTTNFLPGEQISVVASSRLHSATNEILTPHQWQFVAAPTPGAGTFDMPNTITSTANFASGVYAADLDGDGDLDVLSASEDNDTIGWYENNGTGSFTAQAPLSTVSSAKDVHAADLDNDGDMDVLSTSYLAWYENDGAADPTFTGYNVTATTWLANSIHAADIDGDGNIDILSASSFDNTVAWYANDGASPPSFTRHVVTTNASSAQRVFAADVDGDGDMDILSASAGDNTIAWYENDGMGLPTFTSHVITNAANFAFAVYATDLDSDGDVDVISTSVGDDTIAWHENDGNADPTFTSHVITTAYDFPRTVYAADVDGDGDVDILAASSNDQTIALHKNDGTANPSFSPQTLTTSASLAYDVATGDLNGDGDLDVLAASAGDNTISWFDQDNAALPVELTTFTAVQDANDLLLHWQTASETNNAGFEIQQQMPDAAWHTLEFVEGTGTTTNGQQYEHRVTLSTSGLHTFRLKQIDYDGTFSYSDPLEVEAVVTFTWGLDPAYPNPFQDQTHLHYTVATSSRIHIAVYDVLGREVAVLENREQEAGRYEIVWSSPSLASGMYLVRMTTMNGTFTRTVTLQR